MLNIKLSIEVEARLENLAKLTGRTKTFHARRAILENFDVLDSFYSAEKNKISVKATAVKSII
jgi:RHH-type transcriptional regulator, rel operon repressor / antitoxin RelB